MSQDFENILRARAGYFANFVADLREALDKNDVEPSDDALVNVAVQLYAIEPDESELYGNEEAEDEEDEEEWD